MKRATYRRSMKVWYLVLALNLSIGLCLISGTATGQEAKVTSLMYQLMREQIDYEEFLRRGSNAQ